MRLCQSQKVLHPDHLNELLTPRQLQDWKDFSIYEPWGCYAADYRAALTTWGSLQARGGKAPNDPTKLIPEWGGNRPMTQEQYAKKQRMIMARATAGLKNG